MKYTDLKEQQRTELNNFSMFFAFSNQQLADGLKKLNSTQDEVVSIGGGGFIRKADRNAFSEMFTRQNLAMEEAMKDDTFLTSAIMYELGNHEFGITYDPTDTINSLDLDMEDDRVHGCFAAARKEYLSNCDF